MAHSSTGTRSTARASIRDEAFARLDAVYAPDLGLLRLAALADTSETFVKAWLRARNLQAARGRRSKERVGAKPPPRVRRDVKPRVGLGATVRQWTDRHAGTIVEVGEDYFVWQRDAVTRVSGEPPTYRYAPDLEGAKILFKRALRGRHSGQWTEAQRWRHGKGVCPMSRGRADGMTVIIGVRDEYIDPSFSRDE